MLTKYEIARLLPNLRPRYVYGIRSGQFMKVGVTMNIAERLKIMRLSNPHELTVVLRRKVIAAYHCEKKMHEVLKDNACGREWFNVTIEEVRAAFATGFTYAHEVYRSQASRFYADTPVTQAVDDVVESARKLVLT